MLQRISNRAQQAASAATSVVSTAASAATNAATTAASAATDAASSAANAATSAVSTATNAATSAVSGITNLGLDTRDEEIADSIEGKEELPKIDVEEKDVVSKEDKLMSSIEEGEISVFMDMLYHKDELGLDIDSFRDANGLCPLRLAITKGYSGIVELLLKHGSDVGDALLRAVDMGFLETVKIIVEYAESLEGEEYTRGILDCRCDDDDYHADVTPIVLAAQQNDFAIVKVLTEAGCKIRSIALKKRRKSKTKRRMSFHPTSHATDDLQKSVGSLEVYRALASKAYLILGNEDPIDAAFKLSKKLRDLGHKDVEHKPQYEELAQGVDEVSPELISYARSTEEVLTILTYFDKDDINEDANTNGGPFPKITKAIEVEQKAFVAHPNCQQAVLAKFYGQQAFLRDQGSLYNFFYLMLLIIGFPFLSLAYLYVPIQKVKGFMKCPYTKFALKLASDLFFIILLTVDVVVQPAITDGLALETPTSALLLIWILGIMWSEMKLIYRHGIPKLTDFAQWRDILLVVLYILGVLFDLVSFLEHHTVDDEGNISHFKRDLDQDLQHEVDVNIFYKTFRQSNFTIEPEVPQGSMHVHHRFVRATNPRGGGGSAGDATGSSTITNEEYLAFIAQSWYEPRLIASTMFAMSTVISFLRMLQYVVISDVIGPFQISLGSMVTKTANFFVVVGIVLFSFAIGLTYLYAYYIEINNITCTGNDAVECTKDRFSNMFYSSLYLFWSIMGVEDQQPLLLPIQAGVIEDAGKFLYALFYIFMIIVLLNALIAVMSEAYNTVEENADVEWKFHSTAMWMSILLDDDVVPPPFNLFPSVRSINACVAKTWKIKSCFAKKQILDEKVELEPKQEDIRDHTNDTNDKVQYKRVIDKLVDRYVTAKNEVSVSAEVTIADVLALKNDLQGLKLRVFQRLFETNLQVHQATDVGILVRNISERAKGVLNKAEAINDDVDSVLLKLVSDFKDYVTSKREVIKQYVKEVEELEAPPPPGLFSRLVDSFGSMQKIENADDKGKSVTDYHRGNDNEPTTRKTNAPATGLSTTKLGLISKNKEEIPEDDTVTNPAITKGNSNVIFQVKGSTQDPVLTNGRLLSEANDSTQDPALNEKTKEHPTDTGIFSTLLNNFLSSPGSSGALYDSAVAQVGDTYKHIEETDGTKQTTNYDGKGTGTDQEAHPTTVYPASSHNDDQDAIGKFRPIEPAKTTKGNKIETRRVSGLDLLDTYDNVSIGTCGTTSELSEESVEPSLRLKSKSGNLNNETKEEITQLSSTLESPSITEEAKAKNTKTGFFSRLSGSKSPTTTESPTTTDETNETNTKPGSKSPTTTEETKEKNRKPGFFSRLPGKQSPTTTEEIKEKNKTPGSKSLTSTESPTNIEETKEKNTKPGSKPPTNTEETKETNSGLSGTLKPLTATEETSGDPDEWSEISSQSVDKISIGESTDDTKEEMDKGGAISKLVRSTMTFHSPKLTKRNNKASDDGNPQQRNVGKGQSEDGGMKTISALVKKTVAFESPKLMKRNSGEETSEEVVTNCEPEQRKNGKGKKRSIKGLFRKSPKLAKSKSKIATSEDNEENHERDVIDVKPLQHKMDKNDYENDEKRSILKPARMKVGFESQKLAKSSNEIATSNENK